MELREAQREEGFQKPEGLRTPREHVPQNQLNRAHRASQRLKPKSQNLHGSASALCIYITVAYLGVFVKLLTVGADVPLTLLPALRTLYSY